MAILTGAGRAFCAGLDLKELAQGKGLIEELAQRRNDRVNLTTPFQAFGRPVIGAINGPAITGGFELALACDILIASTQASFADTHARVGIILGSRLSRKLSRLIDDGFQMTFADGVELERKMNSAQFQTLQAETIAERRKDVIARGRDQQKTD